MEIRLEQVSKRFLKYWIFRDISYTFAAPGAYALLGPNGSGKSTLLRIIAGMQSASKGKMVYYDGGAALPQTGVFAAVSFCAPGMEVVEELTLREFLEFHFSFKPLQKGLTINGLVDIMGLQSARDKPIGDFSSGMKQRVKLAQAIFADTPVLLLDEPCTNLDLQGAGQYREWIERYAAGRLTLIASNDPREYFFCKQQLVLEDYK